MSVTEYPNLSVVSSQAWHNRAIIANNRYEKWFFIIDLTIELM